MRAEYKTVCVKFRTDDAAQMRAWNYLRSRAPEKSYSALIADAVSVMNREEAGRDDSPGTDSHDWEQINRMENLLLEIKAICTAATDGAVRSLPTDGRTTDKSDVPARPEEARHENEIPQKFLDFVLGMVGDPDDED